MQAKSNEANIYITAIQTMFDDIVRYTFHIAKNIEEYKIQYEYYKSTFINICRQLNELYSVFDYNFIIAIEEYTDAYNIQIIDMVAKTSLKYLKDPAERYDNELAENIVDKIIEMVLTAQNIINYNIEPNNKYRKAELINLASKLIYKFAIYDVKILNVQPDGKLDKGCFIIELNSDTEDRICENMYNHYIKKYDDIANNIQ